MDTIDVCEACIYLEANGADSYFDGNEDMLALSVAGWENHPGMTIAWTYADDDTEHEGYPVSHFSAAPCAICGTHMAGDRHPCTYSV